MQPEQLTIAIRFALYANLMVVFGWPLFAFYGPRDAAFRLGPNRRVLLMLAASGILLSLVGIAAMAATMMGVALVEVDRASVATVVFETPMGAAWRVRIMALIALVILAAVVRPARSAAYVAVVVASGVALASLAWTGHGAAGEGSAGWLQLAGDIVHLLAAGAWIGALIALVAMLGRRAADWTAADASIAHRALDGFAVAGSVIVGLLVATGLVSGWMLVGPDHVLSLLVTDYGRLLAIKLLLFAGMVGLAAGNRFRLTPALERQIAAGDPSETALAALRRSILVETLLAAAILVAVAWLGTLAPPMAA